MGEVKDYVVGLHALRTFRLRGLQMESIIAPAGLWKGGVCRAECLGGGGWAESKHPELPAPQVDCACGIYGSLSLDRLTEQYTQYANSILAVIAAEGRTIVGTRGIRTQYARVVAWWTPGVYRTGICTVQFKDSKMYASMNRMLRDYGIPKEYDKAVKPDPDSKDKNWWTA